MTEESNSAAVCLCERSNLYTYPAVKSQNTHLTLSMVMLLGISICMYDVHVWTHKYTLTHIYKNTHAVAQFKNTSDKKTYLSCPKPKSCRCIQFSYFPVIVC